jgi:uncharacterized damage-inducible protein DinB
MISTSSTGVKELMSRYAAHNLWAHQQLLNVIASLPQEKIQAPVISSFNSLFATVLHLYDAEHIWWQRLKLNEHIIRPSENFSGSFAELQQLLLKQSQQFTDWVQQATEVQLQHVFAYQRQKHVQEKYKVWETLLHLFNHNSYHRGQLVTLLRQLGVTNIPSSDFLAYMRKHK